MGKRSKLGKKIAMVSLLASIGCFQSLAGAGNLSKAHAEAAGGNSYSLDILNAASGKTPQYMGENLLVENRAATSYQKEWVKSMKLNAVRLWVQAQDFELKNDNVPYGNGVTDEASFEAAKAAVIANPENNSYINWDAYNESIRTYHLDVNSEYFKEAGITPFIDLRTYSHPDKPQTDLPLVPQTYADDWEIWEYNFVLTYYLHKNFGFSNFEVGNEPNIKSEGFTGNADDYLKVAYLAQDAIKSAYAASHDSSTPNIYGPVNATPSDTVPRQFATDVLNGIGPDGQPGDTYFNGFSFHNYRYPYDRESKVSAGKNLTAFQDIVKSNNPDGNVEDIIITEFNNQAGQTDANDPLTNANMAKAVMQVINVGKGPEAHLNTLLKFHFIVDAAQNKNGSTESTAASGNEVAYEQLYYFTYSMLMEAAENSKDVMAVNSTLGVDDALVTKDDHYYYVLLNNNGSDQKSVTIGTSQLGIESSPVFMKTANGSNRGTVSETNVVGGQFQITLDPDTVILAKIPMTYVEKPISSIAISPTDTVTVTKYGAKLFQAIATYADGTQEDISDKVTWASSDPADVTMLSTGLAYSKGSLGTAALTASYKGVTSNPVIFNVKDSDNTPPQTTATVDPQPNASGWYNHDVTVALNASDNDGGWGVKQIVTSEEGAQTVEAATYNGDATSAAVTAEGTTLLHYYATDAAGNQEQQQTLPIRLDKTAPAISFTGVGSYTLDQTVSVSCMATDNVSGVQMSSCGEPLVNAPASGMDPGDHTVTATAADNADNQGSAEAHYTIQVTYDGVAYYIGQTVQNGGIRNSLLKKLEEDEKQDHNFNNLINEVNAQKGKHIDSAAADQIIAYVGML